MYFLFLCRYRRNLSTIIHTTTFDSCIGRRDGFRRKHYFSQCCV